MGEEFRVELFGFDGIRRTTVGGILDAVFMFGRYVIVNGLRFFVIVPVEDLRTRGNTESAAYT